MGAIGTPDYYYSPTLGAGGANDGSTWANAFTGLASVAALAAGKVVACYYAATDTVAAAYNSTANGTLTARIIFYSADNADDSFRVGFTIDGDSTSASAFTGSLSYWSWHGILFENFTATVIDSTGSDECDINNCRFENNGTGECDLDNGASVSCSTSLNCGGFAFDMDIAAAVDNLYVFNATNAGVRMSDGSVTDSVFDDCNPGVTYNGNVTGIVVGCTFYSCTSGVTFNAKNLIRKCVFSTCTAGITGNAAQAFLLEDYNVFYNNTADITTSGFTSSGGNSVSTAVNPLTDAANKDYSRVSGTSVIGLARKPGASWDTTIQTTAYVTAGAPPAYAASGGGCFIQQSNSARLGVREC